MAITEIVNYQQSHDEIQEIIGQVPSRVVRWGITFLLLLLLTILFISRYLYLPVSIKATATLTAKESYHRVVWTNVNPDVDYIVKVVEHTTVHKNDTLLIERNRQTGQIKYYRAPLAGQIAMFTGTEQLPSASVLIVLPTFSGYRVELKVPVNGAGQLRAGQKVILRLDEFPESKFGFLVGKVAQTALIPIDKFYHINVVLTNGIITNTNQRIPLQASVSGTAEIIIENTTIFEKLFKNLL